MMTKRYKFPLVVPKRTNIRSVRIPRKRDIFQLTKVRCSVRRLCSEEKAKLTFRINPNSPIAWEKIVSTCWWKWSFVFIGTPRFPNAFRACDRSCNKSDIKTMPVCFSTKGKNSVILDYFHVVWNTPHSNTICIWLE